MENVWVAQPKTSRPDELFWKGERENEGMGLRQGSRREGESATRLFWRRGRFWSHLETKFAVLHLAQPFLGMRV